VITNKEVSEVAKSFADHAALSQNLKRIVYGHNGVTKLKPYQCEAVEMILQEITKIVNGNPENDDAWLGISSVAQMARSVNKGNAE